MRRSQLAERRFSLLRFAAVDVCLSRLSDDGVGDILAMQNALTQYPRCIGIRVDSLITETQWHQLLAIDTLRGMVRFRGYALDKYSLQMMLPHVVRAWTSLRSLEVDNFLGHCSVESSMTTLPWLHTARFIGPLPVDIVDILSHCSVLENLALHTCLLQSVVALLTAPATGSWLRRLQLESLHIFFELPDVDTWRSVWINLRLLETLTVDQCRGVNAMLTPLVECDASSSMIPRLSCLTITCTSLVMEAPNHDTYDERTLPGITLFPAAEVPDPGLLVQLQSARGPQLVICIRMPSLQLIETEFNRPYDNSNNVDPEEQAEIYAWEKEKYSVLSAAFRRIGCAVVELAESPNSIDMEF